MIQIDKMKFVISGDIVEFIKIAHLIYATSKV